MGSSSTLLNTDCAGADALVIRWLRLRQLGMVGVGALLVTIGGYVLSPPPDGWNGRPWTKPLMLPVAVLTLMLGLLATSYALVRLFRANVTGCIDHQGLLWKRWSRRIIPWSAIDSYAVENLPGEARTRVINLWLWHPEDWQPDAPFIRWANHRRLPGFGDMSIDLRGTDCSVKRVTATIERVGAVPRRY